MTHMLITNKVKNFPAWEKEFDNFYDFRKSHGELSYHLFRLDDDENVVVTLFRWDTFENAKAFVQSPELKDALEKAGVAEAPDIQFLNTRKYGT